MSILKTKVKQSKKLDHLKKRLGSDKKLIPLNVLLSRDLHLKFKVKATIQGYTMTDVIIKCIEDYVK